MSNDKTSTKSHSQRNEALGYERKAMTPAQREEFELIRNYATVNQYFPTFNGTIDDEQIESTNYGQGCGRLTVNRSNGTIIRFTVEMSTYRLVELRIEEKGKGLRVINQLGVEGSVILPEAREVLLDYVARIVTSNRDSVMQTIGGLERKVGR